MNSCVVILTKSGIVQNAHSFVGHERGPALAPYAEALFRDFVRQIEPGITPDELAEVTEREYFAGGNNQEVQIMWPLVHEVG